MSNESAPEEEKEAIGRQSPPPLLKTLEDILHNRIIQKKEEMHNSQNRSVTDSLWTEIETLQWVLSQSLSVRRRLGNERYYY
jgi:hypothetical protein